jgi:nitrite reductase/ring-hydroxylating ferredoxin subunit
MPLIPQAWYYVCSSDELIAGASKPKGFTVADKEFIAYRTSNGSPIVLAGRCCHFGSPLVTGHIVKDCVACAFHGWHFNADGACCFIPAGDPIPEWARLRRYPVTERYGQVFFFYGDTPRFELPQFIDVQEQDLVWSKPNFFHIKTPWYLIPANGFDIQHFRSGHDRLPIEKPEIEYVGEHEIRILIKLKNVGTRLADKITALIAGNKITLAVHDVGGNSLAVTSQVKRTTTYGFVNLVPISEKESLMVNVVMVKRKRSFLHRLILNRLNALIRREVIRRFLASEQPQLEGCDIATEHFQPSDIELKLFLEWLHRLHGVNSYSTTPTQTDTRPEVP